MIDAAATQEPQPIADFAAKLREEFGEPAPAAEAAPRPPWWSNCTHRKMSRLWQMAQRPPCRFNIWSVRE